MIILFFFVLFGWFMNALLLIAHLWLEKCSYKTIGKLVLICAVPFLPYCLAVYGTTFYDFE